MTKATHIYLTEKNNFYIYIMYILKIEKKEKNWFMCCLNNWESIYLLTFNIILAWCDPEFFNHLRVI